MRRTIFRERRLRWRAAAGSLVAAFVIALAGFPMSLALAGPDHATGQERAEEKRAAEAQEAEGGRQDEQSSEAEQAQAEQAETQQADGQQADAKQSEAKQSEAKQSEAKQSEAKQSEAEQAESEKTEPEKKTEAKQAETQQADDQQVDSQQSQATGNPPGNNGTVKIDGIPFDDFPDNEPHPGCEFQLDFYGYDEGDLTATYDLDLHAPTGTMDLIDGSVSIGEDPAGGGTDLDATVTLDPAETLAESGVEPHPEQGWHVRLTVNAEGSIGADVKHKMFWIECELGEVGGGGVTPPGNGEGPPGAEVGGEFEERERPAEVLGVMQQREADVEGFLAVTGSGVAGLALIGLTTTLSGALLRRAARARR